MKMKYEKVISLSSAILGVSGVAYGMVAENDVLFVVGLVFVVGGYLIIRRRLKADAKRQNP